MMHSIISSHLAPLYPGNPILAITGILFKYRYMAERRNSLASEGLSDYADGVELINKVLLIKAQFSPNSSPGQPELVQYDFDMTVESMNGTLYNEQFGNNTYEDFDGSFSDMTDEEMVEGHYGEQFGNNKYENTATSTLYQLPHITMMGEFEDSLPKVGVSNRDKDECCCSICLEYYRDEDNCSCSICLGYYLDKYGCRCSICLEYYCRTDKAFSPTDACKGTAAPSSSGSFISVSESTDIENHVESQDILKYVLPVKGTYLTTQTS